MSIMSTTINQSFSFEEACVKHNAQYAAGGTMAASGEALTKMDERIVRRRDYAKQWEVGMQVVHTMLITGHSETYTVIKDANGDYRAQDSEGSTFTFPLSYVHRNKIVVLDNGIKPQKKESKMVERKKLEYEDLKKGMIFTSLTYNNVYEITHLDKTIVSGIYCRDARGEDANSCPDTIKLTFEVGGRVFKAMRIGKGIKYTTTDDVDPKIEGVTDKLSTLKARINAKVKDIEDNYVSREQVEIVGAEVVPETAILEDVGVILDGIRGTTHEKFNHIVGNISKLTSSINDTFSLQDTKELADAFIETKKKIENITNTKPGKVAGFMKTFTSKIPGTAKLMESVSTTLAENSSVQKNINYLFGIIHTKYEKLITVGEGLQSAKGHIVAQVKALEVLRKESDSIIKRFKIQANIPIRELSLNTQIKASIEKYKGRLLKIDGAITATQTTILALGKDLPSLKTDLTDEMAIGGLLNSVDDYQKMYADIALLVSDVTRATSEKVHTTIENLLDLQINDTHMTDHLGESAERTVKFAAMIDDKTSKLEEKVHKDRVFIAEVIENNMIEQASKNIKRIGQ